MSRTSEQMLRQMKLIAEMRKGGFLNAQSFARQLAFYMAPEPLYTDLDQTASRLHVDGTADFITPATLCTFGCKSCTTVFS